jgi:hypothetical protein
MPINFFPKLCATSAVVPLPMKGSSTMPPLGRPSARQVRLSVGCAVSIDSEKLAGELGEDHADVWLS